jgi:hypothetical protein
MGSSNVWAALRPLSSAHTTALRGCFEEKPSHSTKIGQGRSFAGMMSRYTKPGIGDSTTTSLKGRWR